MVQKSRFYVDIRCLHSEVTGSCNICKVRMPSGEKRMFIVDIGTFQESEYEEQNDTLTFNPEDACFILLTHNHVDHVGRLPLLYKRGCTANTYCTHGTYQALPINLQDSVRIMEDRQKKSKKEYLKSNGRGKYGYRSVGIHVNWHTPLYTGQDVDHAMEYVEPVEYGKWITDKRLPNVRFKMFRNAHLPGAASILVEIWDGDKEKINLFFTGDWNVKNTFQGSFPFPQELRDRPVHIITESTYGATNSSDITPCFQENISRAVRDGMRIVLPAISQYRFQEMFLLLKRMQEMQIIHPSIPIAACGPLGVHYTTLYRLPEFTDIPEEMKDFLPCNMNFITTHGGEFESFLSKTPNAIFVPTGGMCAFGPSVSFLRRYIEDSNTLFHFTSYCAENTLGHQLKEVEQGGIVNVGGSLCNKHAKFAYTSEFSGHAKADELLNFLSGCRKIKSIMVTHGSKDSKSAFHKLLEESNIAKEVVELDKHNYVRLNQWGIMEKKSWYE